MIPFWDQNKLLYEQILSLLKLLEERNQFNKMRLILLLYHKMKAIS
jgi:hypothetical protein